MGLLCLPPKVWYNRVMETISGGPSDETRDFQPNAILEAAKLNKALENWVVTEVPGDEDGEIGDVVFVTGPGDGGSSPAPSGPAPGLVHIATKSFDGENDVTMDGVFTSDYDNYRIIFEGRQAGTFNASPPVFMELRSNGATTGGTQYGTNLIYTNTGGQPLTAYAANQGACQISNIGNGSTYATFDLLRPALKLTTHWSGTYGGWADANNFAGSINSWLYGDADADGFRIWPQTGGFTRGLVQVYGYSKGA